MVDLQHSVPLICVEVRYVGLGRSRSWRERDLYAIDDDVIGTGFAGSREHRGERALALPTWHCRRLRRRWHWHWHGLDQLIIVRLFKLTGQSREFSALLDRCPRAEN